MNTRKVVPIVLIVLGALCLIYGFIFHVLPVWSKGAAPAEPAQLRSEGEVMQDAAAGGVNRTETGQLQQTYSGTETPAAECPT